MLLGLLALVALAVIGGVLYLKQRRTGTIVAVSIPLRTLPSASRVDETATRH